MNRRGQKNMEIRAFSGSKPCFYTKWIYLASGQRIYLHYTIWVSQTREK